MYSLALVHHNFVNFKLADAENEIALMHPQAQDTSQVIGGWGIGSFVMVGH